jgi:hypothetical protein
LADVYLYSVDDLGRMVQSGTDARRAAVVQAEAIIETRVQGFMHWLQSREVVPAILDLQQAAEQVREAELERARRALAKGESPELVLEQLAHGLTQKYMRAAGCAQPQRKCGAPATAGYVAAAAAARRPSPLAALRLPPPLGGRLLAAPASLPDTSFPRSL